MIGIVLGKIHFTKEKKEESLWKNGIIWRSMPLI